MLGNTTTSRNPSKPKFRVITNPSPPPDQPERSRANPRRAKRIKNFRETAARGAAQDRMIGARIVQAAERRLAVCSDPEVIERVRSARAAGWEMEKCGAEDNQVLMRDLHVWDEDEIEFFNGWGREACCLSFACSYHQAKRRRRSRKTAFEAIESYQRQPGEVFVLATGTNTTMPHLKYKEAAQLQNKTFHYFQKSAWFARHIIGGCRCVECTLGADAGLFQDYDGDGNGYHFHTHMLLLLNSQTGREIRTRAGLEAFELEFREAWTRAFMTACRKLGEVAPIPETDEGTYIGDVRHLYAKTEGGDPIEDGLNEVIKYVGKPSDWANMSDGQLLDVTGMNRPPRMFEIFGCLKTALQAKREASVSCLDTENVTSGISDIRSAGDWSPEEADRLWERRRSQVDFAVKLACRADIEPLIEGQDWEELIDETLRGLDRLALKPVITGENLTGRERGRDWRLALGEAVWEVRAAERLGGRGVTGSALAAEILRVLGDKYLERRRNISRRERDKHLSEAEYKRNRDFDWTLKQSFARYRLARRFPFAEFVTLTGESWEGVRRHEIEGRAAAVA